jgi:hypothetical protein
LPVVRHARQRLGLRQGEPGYFVVVVRERTQRAWSRAAQITYLHPLNRFMTLAGYHETSSRSTGAAGPSEWFPETRGAR